MPHDADATPNTGSIIRINFFSIFLICSVVIQLDNYIYLNDFYKLKIISQFIKNWRIFGSIFIKVFF